MLMTGIFGQVVHRRAMTHVRMGKQSRILESLESPIHGRPVETGPAFGPRPVVDAGGTQMFVVSSRHNFADGTSGVGDPITPIAQRVDQLVGCDVHREQAKRGPGLAIRRG